MNTLHIRRHPSREKIASLTDVLGYRNPDVVDRIEHDHRLTAHAADLLFRDTIRFLYLAGATGARGLTPTKSIDKGWHSFLMFTRDYAEFCDAYFHRFIHHEPRRRCDPPLEGNRSAATFDLARRHFGRSLSSNWNYDLQTASCKDCEADCKG